MTADGTYRPSARVTNVAELESLPVGSVVLDKDGDAWQRCEDTTRRDEDGEYMRSAWACPAWTNDRTSAEMFERSRIGGLHVEPVAPLTVLFRPDAPQPATTDDTVERAARAIARAADADYWVEEIARWEGQEQWERDAHPDEYPTSAYEDRDAFRSQARAALAAAGAGAEVDREALREAMLRRWWMDQTGPEADRWETLDADERENVAENSYADTFLAAVLDFLAARGDAATPTEVEWGVRWPNSDVEKCGAPGTADDYEDESVAEHGLVRVQRTVSAWREVR